MASKQLFRVAFLNHGKVWELYCQAVVSSGLWGFLEISDIVFDAGDAVVIDPVEEKMRDELGDVEVLHLPMHSVLRVEQVRRKGQSVIRDRETGEKITPFPLSPPGRSGK
jgi:hypothetical protein